MPALEGVKNIKRLKTLSTLVACAFALSAAAPGSAAVSFENTSGSNWTLDFDPITFTATKTGGGDYDWLIFEDFFQANATTSGTTPGQQLQMSINGAPAVSLSLNSANGPFNGAAGGLDQNDLLINVTSAGKPTINAGDTIVVSAPVGGFTLTADPTKVPAVTTSPTVDAAFYSAGGGGSLSTDLVAVFVPEPGSLALLGLGGIFMFKRRRSA